MATDMHKNEWVDDSKGIKARALILCARHIVMTPSTELKYHQNIPNGTQVVERTIKCLRIDGRIQGSLLYPPKIGRGIESNVHS